MQVQVSEQIVADVAKQVLETMAFAFAMPGDEEAPVEGDIVCGVVLFQGPFAGSVRLVAPDAVVQEFAANMLGQDDGGPCSRQQRNDAFGELANVMCGNLVQRLAGPKPGFRLETPQISTGPDVAAAVTANAHTGSEPAAAARVPLDNGWVELTLFLEAETPDLAVTTSNADSA